MKNRRIAVKQPNIDYMMNMTKDYLNGKIDTILRRSQKKDSIKKSAPNFHPVRADFFDYVLYSIAYFYLLAASFLTLDMLYSRV